MKSRYEFDRSENCTKWFAKRVQEIALQVNDILFKSNATVILNTRQKLKHIIADKCYLCKEPFSDQNPKVMDHDHISGQFLGSCHNTCNLNAQKKYILPVFFHNFSGFDSHIIIRDVAKYMQSSFEVIAKNAENYICLTVRLQQRKIKILFLDSFKFLSSSLQSLGQSLPDSEKHLIKKEYPNNYQYLLGKLCFPYEYVDSFDKLREEIPSIENFYSKLSDDVISQQDYQHIREICIQFEIQNLGQLSDLYMKVDVLLLADAFEFFRKNSHQIYKLDPAHYMTLASYSWDCMLRITGVKMKLIKDIEMYTFVESAKRGMLYIALIYMGKR